MKELVELGRFKETVSRGRFSGQKTEFSILIGGDNYSWNISRKNINTTTPPVGQKYFRGFCHLLPTLPEFGIDLKNAVPKIVSALAKNTGTIETELNNKIAEINDSAEIGKLIDNYFKCNYNKVEHDSGKLTDSDRIYVRVLKANLKSTETEEE